MSVNRVTLVGRLGKDPETRYTSGGQAVANFSVATDETYKDKSGEKVKKTEWHRIVLWSKLAEIAGEYLKKGSLVYLEGRIQSKEWEKDGVTRYDKEIVCDRLKMLGGDKEETQDVPTKKAKGDGTRAKAKQVQAETESTEISDEDIPF